MARELVMAAALVALLPSGSAAAADLSAQEPLTVEVALGTADGGRAFVPDTLSFETGKLYKLVLKNPSQDAHYFTALRFAGAVWTRKIETADAEVKGAISEVEVLPGGELEWYFVPVKAGNFDLECSVQGHAERGMVGKIVVQ